MNVQKRGLQTGKDEYDFTDPVLSVCIQLIGLSKRLVRGWFSIACVKGMADFSPLPWGQMSTQ